VILFSHPADFTPVCTTELSAFAENEAYFTSQNTRLIGVSIDSIHSHIAWVQNIQERLGVSIEYPLVADIDTRVAQLYGMLHPGESQTATVRAVFFIDPKGIVRLILYYPLNVGRNIDEVKRVLKALQTADTNACALPANWREGDKVIVPPPRTLADLKARNQTTDEKIDFYLVKKTL
jgi:peroxiredoxin (alkyl hydroperoxide reductase subunit C)